jgi:hypothetical protein
MGTYFKQFSFTLIATTLSISLSSAFATEGEEFFKALRKNPKATPEEIQKLKYEIYDQAQFKKSAELNKQNNEHTKKIESIKPPKINDEDDDKAPPGTNAKLVAGKPTATGKAAATEKPATSPPKTSSSTAKSVPTPSKTSGDSGPVKVDSNMPEEMEFSGSTDEDAETHAPEKTKKADASAPAPTKK